MDSRWFLSLVLVGLFLSCGLAYADDIPLNVFSVDENCHGSFVGNVALACRFGPDPGPGGLPSVMTYSLPFQGTAGDVFLTDPDFGDLRLDVIRFNGDGTLLFYSDNVDGFDDLADTVGPPILNYKNSVSVPEVGPDCCFYTPSAGQPGFDDSHPTYQLISDVESVPEPSSLLLLGGGLASLVGYCRRRHARIHRI